MADVVRPPFAATLAVFAALVGVPLACKPDAKSAIATPPEHPTLTNQRQTDEPLAAVVPPTPARAPRDPVQANHVVFIAKPRPYRPLDCATFDTPAAPHRQPPTQMHDATEFPERFAVPLEVVEILQNPIGPMRQPSRSVINTPQGKDLPNAHVAFALGRFAFRVADHTIDPAVYDARYCQQLNKLISAKFLVVHAYPVYVDHGNHEDEPWSDLGTDAGKANAGFDTLEEAQAHAASILPKPADEPTP